MITVLETSIFREWLVSIKDLATRLRLARRLEKAQRGNLGDIKQLANFLYEMCEFFWCWLENVLFSSGSIDYCDAQWRWQKISSKGY